MAFSFNGAAGVASSTASSAQMGHELPEIQTEQLGYQPISGDYKLQLLPSPWPSDTLPRPNSSLLAVASNRSLLAAAGPNDLVIAGTTSIREAWVSGSATGNHIKSFSPKVKISVPRLSHVAFTADENVLLVTAESSGGLVAYKTDGLAQGLTNPALQIPTNDQALRALSPNPNVQFAELSALVTTNGELLMADLKSGQLRDAANGKILKSGVSCVSWSNQGKQLVAGLADATVAQMTPDGTQKAEIPRPPALESEKHVSALSWLANDSFFIVYSSNVPSSGMAQPSAYFLVSRQPKTQNYTFQALPEVCPAFGLSREPAGQFIARMRKFEPHIEDLLLVASTTSFELGMVTKADAPLSGEAPAADSYALTLPADDSRRAQLPLSLNDGDTSPIGLALDLSATDSIVNPIPSDPEIEQSPGPLPNVLALNHEGVLSSWWIVYADSIRNKRTYSGLVAAVASGQSQQQNAPASARSMLPRPARSDPAAFGQSGFGQAGFGQSGFATQQALTKPATSAPGTDAPSNLAEPNLLSGSKPSWTSTGFSNAPQTGGVALAQPAFGASTLMGTIKPALGAPSPFTGRAVFGQPAATAATPTSGAVFGQSGTGKAKENPFSGSATAVPFGASAGESKGFSSFSTNKGGFAALASDGASKPNPFPTSSARDLALGKAEQPQGLATRSEVDNKPLISGLEGGSFAVGSTFKPDPSPKDDGSKADASGPFSFEGGFGDVLNQSPQQSTPAQSKEEEMGDSGTGPVQTTDEGGERPPLPPESKSQTPLVTPPSTLSHPNRTHAPPVDGLFSGESQTSSTPAAVEESRSGSLSQPTTSTTPQETPNPKPPPLPVVSGNGHRSPQIKSEPLSSNASPPMQHIPKAPLPLELTSKAHNIPGDSKERFYDSDPAAEDAPLAPEVVPQPNDDLSNPSLIGSPNEAGGDLYSDFEGSGEDDANQGNTIDEPTGDRDADIQTSPESSSGKAADLVQGTSPAGGLFTKVSTSQPPRLFGEVATGPILPPPVPQESPRSPSPVRGNVAVDMLRPEASRSISLPAAPASTSVLDRRRTELAKSALASQPANVSDARDENLERAAAAKRAETKAKEEAAAKLEDTDDESLRAELEAPPSPSDRLEPFLPHQPCGTDASNKTGIPGQIERLYRDINSMIDTVGINARSLSAYILYHNTPSEDKRWPDLSGSETLGEGFRVEHVLQDITRAYLGHRSLNTLLERHRISNASEKFDQCWDLLSKDLVQLRTKIISTRKTLQSSSDAQARLSSPLSAEQASLQHDLRKASVAVQSKLVQAEQELTLLRAKLSEAGPSSSSFSSQTTNGSIGGTRKHVALGDASRYKKPTVEAVTSTITKMTSMAEKKRTDVDVLAAQMRRMAIDPTNPRSNSVSASTSRAASIEPNTITTTSPGAAGAAPARQHHEINNGMTRSHASQLLRTPNRKNNNNSSGGGGGPASVYHTPDSTSRHLTTSTNGRKARTPLRGSVDGTVAIINHDGDDDDGNDTDQRDRFQQRVKRRKAVMELVKDALVDRKNKNKE